MAKEKGQKSVTDEVFVGAMMVAESYEEVASRLKLEVASVKSRANTWRKKGIDLPKFEGRVGGKTIESKKDAMNELIAKLKAEKLASLASQTEQTESPEVTA